MSAQIPEDVADLIRDEFGKAKLEWVRKLIEKNMAAKGIAEFNLLVIERRPDTGEFWIGTIFEDYPSCTMPEARFWEQLPGRM